MAPTFSSVIAVPLLRILKVVEVPERLTLVKVMPAVPLVALGPPETVRVLPPVAPIYKVPKPYVRPTPGVATSEMI